MKQSTKKTSPWAWIPTLYFAQGIPYFIVNNISVLMFAKMGVPNGDMALFTSLLYLPWTIKPFWSRLALPAMGNQAFLESICRLDQN